MFKYDNYIAHSPQKNNKFKKIYNLLIINMVLMICSIIIYYQMQIYYAFDRTFQCFTKAISQMRRASKMLSEIKKDTSHLRRLRTKADILIQLSQIRVFIIQNPKEFQKKIDSMSHKDRQMVKRFLLASDLAQSIS